MDDQLPGLDPSDIKLDKCGVCSPSSKPQTLKVSPKDVFSS